MDQPINLRESAEQIGNLARLFRHMEAAQAALMSVADLDQAVQEKQAAIASIEQERARLELAFSTRRDELQAELDQAAGRIESANAEAVNIRAGAEADAAAKLADADRAAALRRADADAYGQRVVAQAHGARDEAQRQAQLARADADQARKDAAEARAELADLTDRIARAKEAAAAVLGA